MKTMKPAKKLGFGLMRLPMHEDRSIDIDQVCQMVDAFMEKGFTYFDTAYVYHEGTSEVAARKALVERYPRDSFTLATKLPAWSITGPESSDQIFQEQLDRAGVDFFDFYLLHAIGADHLKVYEKYNCFEWGLQKKAEGKIRYFGFSFHDTAQLLDEILTKHPQVDFVQLQLNYLDWDSENVQSGACYEVAKKHGVPVVVMEPVKGGKLANMPASASGILKAADPKASLPSWAIRFAASLDNVMVVLSGMSNTEQMADNIATMADFQPLTEKEQELVRETAEKIKAIPTIPCTGCRYCVDGCPQSILIPDLIACYNEIKMYGDHPQVRKTYQDKTAQNGAASVCLQCGQCEGVCPQHLEIPRHMQEIAALFE